MSDTKHTGSAFRPAVHANRDGIALLGRTLHDLRGIRFENEPGGGTPTPTPTPTPPPTPSPTPTPGPTPTPTPPSPTPTPDPTPPAINKATGKPYTPEETQTYIASLRAESKTNREAREAAEKAATEAQAQRDAVLAALGINADGSPAAKTPDQLAAELAERSSAAEAQQRENLVLRVAPTLGANSDKLLDSRQFSAKLSSIKVDDRAGVEALVREFIENDESLKVVAAAAASGGAPHTGSTPPTGRKSMADAISSRMAPGSK